MMDKPSDYLPIVFAFGMGLCLCTFAAHAETQCELNERLSEATRVRALSRASYGLVVKDIDTGETLFETAPDQALVPASNVKLVSSAAALAALGPDYRFRTAVYGHLEKDGRILQDLYVQGNGDPWLVPERIWALANRIKYLGVQSIEGDIVIDDSHFDGTQWPTGWEQDHSSYAYMAPAGAVSVGFNAALIHVYPSIKEGEPAEVRIEPEQGYFEIDNRAVTSSQGRTNLSVSVVPHGNRSLVRVEGAIRVDAAPRRHWRRIDNPALYAGAVFRRAFEQIGIQVKGDVRVDRLAQGIPELAVYSSPRLADLLEKVNKYSNNFMAQQIALALGAHTFGAPATWAKAEAAINGFLENELRFDAGTFAVKNASGLHDVNRVSPTQFVDLLQYMYLDERYSTEFLASLASSGGAGTLSHRMKDSQAEGLIRAKTGTLSIASALSGYAVSESGHTLAFSFIINHYRKPLREVLDVQNKVGEILVGYDGSCSKAPLLSNKRVRARRDGLAQAPAWRK